MKKWKSKILLLGVIALCFSCVKNDNGPTVFDIHCIDNFGNSDPGVAVTVFDNYNDWFNNTNPAYSETTDANGNVSFSGVRAQQYYFYCDDTYNCLTNWSAQNTNGALAAHKTNTLNVVLTPFGTLKVTNTSPGGNPYEIKVNGEVWISSLGYNEYDTEILPTGNATVEAIQLNGPTDNTYSVAILQCQTSAVNIP